MKEKIWPYAALALSATFFGVMTPVAKAAMVGGIPQFTLIGLRMWGAALFFWVLGIGKTDRPVTAKDMKKIAFAAFLGIVCDQGGFILGLSYTSPINAGIICTLIPVFALLLGMIFKGRKPSFMNILGIAIGLTGAVIMVLSSSSGQTLGAGSVLGDLIIIAGLTCFASYLVFFTDIITKYSVITLMKWMFFFAAIMITPICLIDTQFCDFSAISATTWLETAYVVAGGTILAFLCMLEGQKSCSPEVVGVFQYIQPIVTCLLSIAMGLGVFSCAKAAGTALIFMSVLIVTCFKR